MCRIVQPYLGRRTFGVEYQQQTVNQIIKGKRPPPLKHIDVWAAVLGKHIDKELFLNLTRLEHSSERIQKLVTKL